MKLKVIILGTTGMAGHVISKYLKSLGIYKVVNISRKHHDYIINDYTLDFKRFDELLSIIQQENPDYLINCSGILVKASAINPPEAILINSYLPKFLEVNLKRTKIIQLSTDCLFNGDKGKYKEDSIPNGVDMYSRTKMLGEIFNDKDLTIRTSIIGPELKNDGTGLFLWFMNQSDTIKGFSKVIWSGVTTLQLAKAIHSIIGSNITGLYHYIPKKPISKYNLLKLINQIFNKDIEIIPNKEYSNNKSLIDTRKIIPQPESYEKMLIELKIWMNLHKNIYKGGPYGL